MIQVFQNNKILQSRLAMKRLNRFYRFQGGTAAFYEVGEGENVEQVCMVRVVIDFDF
jgi:hypothetical protein